MRAKKKSRKTGLILLILLLVLGGGAAWYFLMGPGVRTYTVSFDSKGGTPCSPAEIRAGRSIELPQPEKQYYTLDGWYIGDLKINSPYTPVDNVTLSAHWTGKTAKIYFDAGEGKPSAETDYLCGSPLVLPEDPTWAKHRFGGWIDAAGKSWKAGDIFEGEELHLYASWNANTFTVIFDTRGGSYVEEIILTEGDALELPGTPSLQDSRFICWEDEHGNPVEDGTILPCEDITLYARWDKTGFLITFDSRGGTELSPMLVGAEQVLRLPSPTRAGYKFLGWQDKYGKVIHDGDVLPCEDITLYAMWQTN